METASLNRDRNFFAVRKGADGENDNRCRNCAIPTRRFQSYDYTCLRVRNALVKQAQTDNDDTLALLDCLGEGAAAEEGGPIREVCAKGVVEFLRYAIKQTSKRQQVGR